MDLDDRQSTGYKKKTRENNLCSFWWSVSITLNSLSLLIQLYLLPLSIQSCHFSFESGSVVPFVLFCFVFFCNQCSVNRQDPCYCHMFNDKILECAQKNYKSIGYTEWHIWLSAHTQTTLRRAHSGLH